MSKFFEALHWYILLLLIFSPKFVVYAIPGLSSAMRIDILCVVLYVSVGFIRFFLRRNSLNSNGFFLIVVLIMAVGYIINSSRAFIAAGQFLLFFSLFCAFAHGASISKRENPSRKIKLIYIFLYINILIHLLFYFLGVETYSGNYIGDSGLDERYYIFGLYGVSSMPFQFAIYIASFVFILMHGNLARSNGVVIGALVACLALLTGDSRISLGALFIAVFGFWAIPIVPVLIISASFFDTKAISVFSNFGEISVDPSLAMRLLNVQNYLDWLSIKTLNFGGGAQSFLEFSEAYGLPGPLDIGYLRLMTEFGLVGIIIIIMSLIIFIKRRFFIANTGLRVALTFCLIYSIFNEGLLASKSGHLMMFIIGILYFKPLSTQSSSVIIGKND